MGHFLKRILNSHTHLKLALIYLALVVAIFAAKGFKGYSDNWSDPVFFAEFAGLCAMSGMLILARNYLPDRRAMLPWLAATGAACAVVMCVFILSIDEYSYSSNLWDVPMSLPSFAITEFHFFNWFEKAPEPGDFSTRPAFLDAQLVMVVGCGVGLLWGRRLQKVRPRSLS